MPNEVLSAAMAFTRRRGKEPLTAEDLELIAAYIDGRIGSRALGYAMGIPPTSGTSYALGLLLRATREGYYVRSDKQSEE